MLASAIPSVSRLETKFQCSMVNGYYTRKKAAFISIIEDRWELRSKREEGRGKKEEC